MKRVVFIGGGPAGLYGAILLKKALPAVKVEVFERNRPDDTFGWGVVFSDQTMSGFQAADPWSHDAINRDFHHWDDVEVHFRGETIRSGGHGFCGIGRRRLLNVFQERAASLGVEQHFQAEINDLTPFADADLIVASDGVNSKTRTQHAAIFQPDIAVGRCRFIWLGTHQKFAAFTFAFEKTEHGWFQIHAYQFSDEISTVIVETREETWLAHGLDGYSAEQSIAFCESLFCPVLRRTPIDEQCESFARLGLAELQPGAVRAMASSEHRADRRCGAYGAFRHRVRHQAGHGGCHVARRPGRQGGRCPGRAAKLSGRTEPGGSQAAERGAQSNGVVRECGAIFAPGTASIRVRAAHGKPAHRPREPQAAGSGIRRGVRALAGRAQRCARCGAAADVSAVPARGHEARRIESSSRPWRSTRQRTGCRTTGI